MNRERLLQVIEAVRNQPDERFDMRWWKRVNCNTTCCAIGSYIEQNPDCGLKLIPDGGFGYLPALADFTGFSQRDDWGLSAIATNFSIAIKDAMALFSTGASDGLPKSAVIARIEAFIAEHDGAEGVSA